MLQNIKKRTEGFTIIEVLIVLAIAGLIMLIVFLAVPALQRNSHNTETRNEASRLLTSTNEFITNANGTLPLQADIQSPNGTIFKSAGLSKITTVDGPAVVGNTPLSLGHAQVVVPGTCTGTTATAGTGRQVAVQFYLEGGQNACISL